MKINLFELQKESFQFSLADFKMFAQTIASVCLLASVATAHFSIEYPQWRGDSFAMGASQYVYPCELLPFFPD